MNKIIAIVLLFIASTVQNIFGQALTYRIKSKYILTKENLASIKTSGFKISSKKDPTKNYSLCRNKLKVLVTQSAGALSLDPWAIDASTDDCVDDIDIINSQTDNDLIIDMNRRKVGQSTNTIKLPYSSFVIGVNAVALKIRPRITDINKKDYGRNVIGGTITLGPTIGYTFGITTFTHRSANSWSVTPGASVGFGALSLKNEPLEKIADVSSSPSNLILSPSFNVILARNDIGLIVSYGWDNMTGGNHDAWAYQGKGFLAIGISAGLKL